MPGLNPSADYDLVVIGGGVNGAGIARDAALRGLRVLLLEKSDFGGETSAWSSRLIHGGLRYLEFVEFPLVFESLHERRRLRQTLAPHLVRKLRINIPVYTSSKRSKLIIRLGMIAYDLLSIGKTVPPHRMLDRDTLLAEEPGLNPDGLLGGAQYFDAQVSYIERLVLENIIAARAAGAEIRNYSPVIGINVHGGSVRSIDYVDQVAGRETEVSTRMVVNAAGPWVDRVLATVNREMPQLMGGTKGSHIVVGAFAGAPKDAFYVEAAADGRPFFIIPWNEQYLIGTTDIRYGGDPGDVRASEEEVDYLLRETNRVFPGAGLSKRDIHYTYAGVRPLPKSGGPEGAITRKHIIKKHRRQARGLISIIGGKLTTYRNLAEQVVNYCGRKLKADIEECVTRTLPLPGATGIDDARTALAELGLLSDRGVERLLTIYGGRAAEIAMLVSRDERHRELLDGQGIVLAGEVVHAMRHEFVVHLVDLIHRRMMIGLSPDTGSAYADEVARIAAAEAGWSRQEMARQLERLREHNERLRPDFLPNL